MTAEEEEGAVAARPGGWRRRLPSVPGMPRFARVLFLIAVALLALLIALWLQRKPLAQGYIDRELARRGVAARYAIDDLGLSTQRLTNVVIGDPANPDLVADWVIVRTAVGLGTAEVRGIEAGHVRLRARLEDGRLSLGALDRLLPPPSGKPFALPQLDLALEDGRMRLQTPHGVIGVKLRGAGVLNDGFAGRIAAVSERIELAGCTAGRVAANMRVTIADGRPGLSGPLRAASVDCGGPEARGVALALEATLGERLDRWRGRSGIRAMRLAGAGAAVRDVEGSVAFEGGPAATTGTLELASGAFSHPDAAAEALSVDGRYRVGTRGSRFAGSLSASGARLADARVGGIASAAAAADGTPVGPLVERAVRAFAAAVRRADVRAEVAAAIGPDGGELALARLAVTAASGASATLSGSDGLRFGWPNGGLRVNGTLALEGGGLPEAAVGLSQAAPGAPVNGTAIVRPYAAGGASLALAPVSFSADGNGATRISTRITLSGPLGDGRVDRLTLPVDARWDGGRRLLVNPGCVPAGFDRLAVAGLELSPTRLRLCPAGAALLALDGSRVAGGARIGAARISGTLGGTPLTLAATGSQFRLTGYGFALQGVETRLGGTGHVSRLDVARLDGRVEGGALAGRFAGGAGQIANVPLLLSDAAGSWRLEDGRLSLKGGVTVADAAETPRFEPLSSGDFRLSLSGDDIQAGGTLALPAKGVKVTQVAIRHDLGTGAGSADLDVPGITFDEGFQPSELTRLTFGVIADVKGTISGAGHIRWSPEGVASTGTFRTAGTDLAAAFGPVTGLSGEIEFSDLLGLKTPPGQLATVAEVNPGIPVEDGIVRYQLLGDERVQVESGRWPLAGGGLVLEPTLLDFSAQKERRMTFRATGVDAALFLQQFEFENLNATGTFDGVLPMVFDERGARIENGRMAVREGGGTVAYVGQVSQEDLGFWGNMAFDALKSLRYRSLDLTLDGPLSGEMLTEIRFAGVSQGEGARSNFLTRRLARLPFVFNVRIRAPFRQLIDSVQSYYDPSRLIERNLQPLLEEQRRREAEAAGKAPAASVQPPESETVP